MNALHTRSLRRDDWTTIETLFGPRGACGGCWCMWWRVPMGGRTWDAAKGEPNRAAFRKLVNSGKASGVLAFHGDEPVGWCAIGPRADFPRVERSKALVRPWSPATWSLNCLYVPAPWRGRGVARALVAGAIDLARQQGAEEVEAYPQSLDPGERQGGAFVWTGVPSLYEPLGFQRQGPPGRGRALYLLKLARPRFAAAQHAPA
ncbi:GNAT family N-acetyltransferase [Lysobacter auxotrophicus]|uniref:GNAT family N-acetyltransferase n=1 Tax=Lysobacter auxotrophicus TaxID=2992573 RepID=A0ABM8DEU7_9GAMM|nr:GNAT family N-acetyltransferase [Lysobacter auxotrophicus]BDU17103.1 GNAT family N-acetyltransferase [Lysobacter auxotrophicus]